MLYPVLLLIAAVLSAIVTVLAWSRRHVRAARPFALLMLAVTAWTLTYVLEIVSPGMTLKVFWVKVQYLSIVFVPVAWLSFSLAYTGRKQWLTRRNLALLSIPPFVVVLLVWTNPAHHLMMEGFRLVGTAGARMLDISRGPVFWLHTTYAYALLALGVILLVKEYLQAGPAYRRQTRLLLIAALIPWVGNVVHVFGQGIPSYLDFTSFLFTISGLVIFWGLFRFQFLDLVPVARNTVVENMLDGVLVVDAENRVMDMNPAAERIVGARRSEVIGKPARQVLASWPDLVERLQAFTEDPVESTFTSKKDGRIYGLSISPLRDAGTRLRGQLITFRDVTERERAETALQRRAAELQARNEELDAFAHTVAHDLKDPLTSIVGYAEVLADYELRTSEQDVQELLEEISASGRKMGSIIDELLLLSMVRQMDDVEREPLDMDAIVTEALRRLKGLRDEHQAEITLPDAWPTALGYGPWVEEVWVNYLSNAIKYGGEPPQVTLGATREGSRICFWVRDNGAGLTPEERRKLFTPFTQLDRSDVDGHGLGLSIVRRIVNKLGGRVVLESAVGEGSLFGFVLDAADRGSHMDAESWEHHSRR